MSGCWVTWPAEIRPRHDIEDIRPYLDQASTILRQHRDVADARYEHNPGSGVVRFVLRVRHGITNVVAERQAFAALKWALPVAGFATKHARPAAPGPVAWLKFTRWPTSFTWR
jgi:hypothetical protein